MTTINHLLSNVRFFDGAMGTECIRRGLAIGTPPELWNLERPDVIREIHLSYIEAGAQVITTNTFGGNRMRLRSHGLENRIEQVNGIAVKLALDAAGKRALVAGSIGPLGELIEPFGSLSVVEARNVFIEQIVILVQAGVDCVLLETMISLDEALIALQAAKERGVNTVGVCFSFEGGRTARTPFGETVGDVMRRVEQTGADVLGANCGDGFETMLTVAKEMKASSTPILIQSNAGLPEYQDGRTRYPVSPESYADFAEALTALRIDFIGGCCGTTPAHIEAVCDRCR